MTSILSTVLCILLLIAVFAAIVALSYFLFGNLLAKLSNRNLYGKTTQHEEVFIQKELIQKPNLTNLNSLLLVMESLDTLVVSNDISSFLDKRKKEDKANACGDS